MGDVGAEHAAVPVALVHDHVVQAPEELPPSGVPGEQHVMQHVRRGEQVVRVGPGPLALGIPGVCAAVVDGDTHSADRERARTHANSLLTTPGMPSAWIARTWSAARALVGAR